MVRWAAARPGRVLAGVLVLALLGAGLALWRLSPCGVDAARWSGRARAPGGRPKVVHERFGDDAVYVLVRGDLARLVLTADLNRLLGLEGCLAGNVPAGADGAGRARRRRAPRWRARSPCGSSTGRARSSTPPSRRSPSSCRRRRGRARRRPTGRRRRRAGSRARRGARRPRPSGSASRPRSSSTREFAQRAAGAEREVRAEPDRARRRSTTRTSSTSSSSIPRAGRACRRRASRTCSRRRTRR